MRGKLMTPLRDAEGKPADAARGALKDAAGVESPDASRTDLPREAAAKAAIARRMGARRPDIHGGHTTTNAAAWYIQSMQPRLFHRLRAGAALSLATFWIGCAPPASRTFAVVLQEPRALRCYPKVTLPEINAQDFFAYLIQTPALWEDKYEGGFLRPSGSLLHAVSSSRGLYAWFDDFQRDPYSNWNETVFEGSPHDDYIEVSSVQSHDPDFDEASGCGELTDVQSDLLATIDGSLIDGRIRRVEYRYFSSNASACAAYVACARNIRLRGAEVE
jgi:hypothetical protein